MTGTVGAAALRRDLRAVASPERARRTQAYFKTGKGEYGEGDRFLGVDSPNLRRISRAYGDLARTDVRRLLASPWHEERLLALLILVRQYQRADAREREAIFRLYLASTRHINNWDLVDLSAADIIGAHLADGDRTILRRLARSSNLWERRIAIIATAYFIRNKEFADTIAVAKVLLEDRHDLIHKAVGWMLREVGKRDRRTLEQFLERHASSMPRTMLRYAIEHFPEPQRKRYLGERTVVRRLPA